MPCVTQPNLTQQARDAQRAAIARLEKALGENSARAVIGPQGAIAFQGWTERGGVSDLCAYRVLASTNSAALRRAIMRAEALAGRKMDARAVAAGIHSHDAGAAWHPGH